jgi:hypothetical protein
MLTPEAIAELLTRLVPPVQVVLPPEVRRQGELVSVIDALRTRYTWPHVALARLLKLRPHLKERLVYVQFAGRRQNLSPAASEADIALFLIPVRVSLRGDPERLKLVQQLRAAGVTLADLRDLLNRSVYRPYHGSSWRLGDVVQLLNSQPQRGEP